MAEVRQSHAAGHREDSTRRIQQVEQAIEVQEGKEGNTVPPEEVAAEDGWG